MHISSTNKSSPGISKAEKRAEGLKKKRRSREKSWLRTNWRGTGRLKDPERKTRKAKTQETFSAWAGERKDACWREKAAISKKRFDERGGEGGRTGVNACLLED